jgi:hypothetical protein
MWGVLFASESAAEDDDRPADYNRDSAKFDGRIEALLEINVQSYKHGRVCHELFTRKITMAQATTPKAGGVAELAPTLSRDEYAAALVS